MKEFDSENLPFNGPLKDDLYYRVRGKSLNDLHDFAVEQFSQAPSAYEQHLPFTYSQAFWNGYGKAIDGVRGLAYGDEK